MDETRWAAATVARTMARRAAVQYDALRCYAAVTHPGYDGPHAAPGSAAFSDVAIDEYLPGMMIGFPPLAPGR